MRTRISPFLFFLWTMVPCPSCGRLERPSDEMEIRLSGSNYTCVGRPELSFNGIWKTVCNDSWNMQNLAVLCRQLGCGQPFGIFSNLNVMAEKEPKLSIFDWSLQCQGNETRLLNCISSIKKINCTHEQDTIVACTGSQPPPTPTPAPTTSPPKVPLKFRLIDGNFSCSGTVEVHMRGSWRTVCSNRPSQIYKDMICSDLGCGSALPHIHSRSNLSYSPVLWEEECVNMTITEKCFEKTASCESLEIVCSKFQPKVATRLVNGPSRCEGNVEVYYQGSWKTLCGDINDLDSRKQVCMEQRCGNPTVTPTKTKRGEPIQQQHGLSCTASKLEECHTFTSKDCIPTRVTCEDPGLKKNKGLAAGDVMSIIFALVLLGIILVFCGPPIYKKVMKKYNRKKERQWIGPTGASQSISFHRNNTVNLRSQSQDWNDGNEYSEAPKKNSHLSAYPALEGALNRASFPVENSSDSDYDVHATYRL